MGNQIMPSQPTVRPPANHWRSQVVGRLRTVAIGALVAGLVKWATPGGKVATLVALGTVVTGLAVAALTYLGAFS